MVTRNALEKQRLTLNEKAIETQIAVQETKVQQEARLALVTVTDQCQPG